MRIDLVTAVYTPSVVFASVVVLGVALPPVLLLLLVEEEEQEC